MKNFNTELSKINNIKAYHDLELNKKFKKTQITTLACSLLYYLRELKYTF
jgi:hypothetical protein